MRLPVRAGNPPSDPVEYATEIYDADHWLVCNANGYVVRDRIIAALNAQRADTEVLALLRELNDALVIPGRLQPRVDAVLDRAEEKP